MTMFTYLLSSNGGVVLFQVKQKPNCYADEVEFMSARSIKKIPFYILCILCRTCNMDFCCCSLWESIEIEHSTLATLLREADIL